MGQVIVKLIGLIRCLQTLHRVKSQPLSAACWQKRQLISEPTRGSGENSPYV